MKKLFAVDLKRLLNNKTAVLFAIGAPLLLVLLVAFAVAPYFYADVRAQHFSVAVYNEDDDALTNSILSSLIESRSLGGLISVDFVDSDAQGRRKVKDGAAAFIHLPKGMQDTLYHNGRCVIGYYGNPDMPLEDALLFETLDAGVSLVSDAQHAINVLYWDSLDAGVDDSTAADAYDGLRNRYFGSILGRSALYERTAETSPLGGALPVEYYAASFLVLFVALGGLPVARITADDGATGLVHRQLLSGHSPAACVMSRWLAGALFLLIQYAVLALALALGVGRGTFAGSLPAAFAGACLLSLFVSLLMMLVGLWSRTSAVSARAAFLSALALALLGGLLVPSAYMPGVMRDVSYYTPFSAALRLTIAGLFDGQASGVPLFLGVLAACTAALLPVAMKRFQRRTR